MNANQGRVDVGEVEQFAQLATHWWDPEGPLRTLHAINALRLDYLDTRRPLSGLRVADIGCGGGILSEAMASAGARVTGVDMAAQSIEVARAHAATSGYDIEYEVTDAVAFAQRHGGEFDVVTCLELLEHVPDPAATVAACAALLKPGGDAFFSTINRNAKSFALAIVAAEYVLGIVPRGTHRYRRLIRPAELAQHCRAAGLRVRELTGLHYDPLTNSYLMGSNVDVNYFCHATFDG
jgi:2-polyprenyl-6-hydroxyphenyl methylase/3-demethylubiquinone-9 3-methyltransferase